LYVRPGSKQTPDDARQVPAWRASSAQQAQQAVLGGAQALELHCPGPETAVFVC
jgi:hypothetical protein